VKGPGGITPDERPWEQVRKEYAFVEEMAALRPHIKGRGNVERFDYWLNHFHYLRAIGKVNCTWAKFNAAMKRVKAEKEPKDRRRLAQEIALPIRKELIARVTDVHRYLLAAITTNGGMGNVTNWQQHIMPTLVTEPGKELAGILGRDLPADAILPKSYDGPLRLIVPTVRTSLSPGEDLKLKVIVLTEDKPKEATLYWRAIGEKRYKEISISHLARGVYSACLSADMIENDFEYYIKVTSVDREEAVFPATAPEICQTVVIVEQ
jgi:hypothetical protein